MYKPRTNSFASKTLAYLKAHGESKNSDIRSAIGLDEWSKRSDYSDRSSYHFDIIVRRLIYKGLVIRTQYGYYSLASNPLESKTDEETIKLFTGYWNWLYAVKAGEVFKDSEILSFVKRSYINGSPNISNAIDLANIYLDKKQIGL